MRTLKVLVSLTTLLGALSVLASFAPGAGSAQAAGPGNCGEYMYWQNGKCVDARNRGAEPWPEQMAKKKATW